MSLSCPAGFLKRCNKGLQKAEKGPDEGPSKFKVHRASLPCPPRTLGPHTSSQHHNTFYFLQITEKKAFKKMLLRGCLSLSRAQEAGLTVTGNLWQGVTNSSRCSGASSRARAARARQLRRAFCWKENRVCSIELALGVSLFCSSYCHAKFRSRDRVSA